MRIKSVFYTESTFRISSAFKSSIFEADQNGFGCVLGTYCRLEPYYFGFLFEIQWTKKFVTLLRAAGNVI